MIKNLIFDLGGVIITLAPEQAVARFKEIGLKDAEQRLDSYTQAGIFGDLELGKITDEEFQQQISMLAGKEISYEECRYAWLGYCREVPQRNLDALLRLRSEGIRVLLISNTNPFMMSWVMSPEFDGQGHSLSYYMDACYMSYKMGVMKPSEEFFLRVLEAEQIQPEETLFVDDGRRNVEAAAKLGMHTLCPINGEDWTKDVFGIIHAQASSPAGRAEALKD